MQTETPLISIVTPTYNRADFIKYTIESALAQTYPNFEMLIIDDGSTDITEDVVSRYQDTRIIYEKQANKGQSVARNRAIEKSRGEFICFLDSDDIWFPNKLEISLAAFRDNPSIDIFYSDRTTIDENGKEISQKNMRRHSGFIASKLLKDNFISMTTVMVRKKCFDELGVFDTNERWAEDYELWLRFASKYCFFYQPIYLAAYRVMENQLSSNKLVRLRANENIILNFLEKYPHVISAKEKKIGLANFYIRKSRFLAETDTLASYKSIFTAIVYRPFTINTWRAFFRISLDSAKKIFS